MTTPPTPEWPGPDVPGPDGPDKVRVGAEVADIMVLELAVYAGGQFVLIRRHREDTGEPGPWRLHVPGINRDALGAAPATAREYPDLDDATKAAAELVFALDRISALADAAHAQLRDALLATAFETAPLEPAP